jgi:hypothetical protein
MQTSKRRSRRPSCSPRIKYSSQEDAERAAAEMTEVLGQSFRAALCVHCFAWHILPLSRACP